MNDPLATFSERLAGKAPAQKLLGRLGLDASQFVLFLQLFRTLSEREEFMSMIGVNRFSLSYMALFSGVLGTFLWAALTVVGIPAPLFLLINLTVAFILIFPTVLREAANALFNPVEASMLAASPVHSLTYAAAKIAHILITVSYMVAALTIPAALLGIFLKGTHWYWPVTHLAAAYLIGIAAAFLVCALYGLLTRVFPAHWLKGISMWVQLLMLVAIPYFVIFFHVFLVHPVITKFIAKLWSWSPFMCFVKIGYLGCRGAPWQIGWREALSILVTLLIIGFGLRSFAGTYFSLSSAFVQGRARRNKKSAALSYYTGVMVCRLTGSPTGLAAFSFVGKMMRRDWQFRRNILTQTLFLPLFVVIILMVVFGSSVPTPLNPNELSAAHFLPHLFGVMAMSLCAMVPFTDFREGSWIYLTAPMDNLRAFARGVYCALWLPVAGWPHLILLPLLIRLWGWKAALFLIGFSLIVVSLYLAFEMKLIAGLPFSEKFDEARRTVGGVTPMFWWVGIFVAGLLQWALFHRWWIALIAEALLLVATVAVFRMALKGFEEELRWRLYLLKSGPNQMFKEVE